MGHETPLTFFLRKFDGHRWGHEKLFCKNHWPWNDVHCIFKWFSWDFNKSEFHNEIWWPSPQRHASILLRYTLCQGKKCLKPFSKPPLTALQRPLSSRSTIRLHTEEYSRQQSFLISSRNWVISITSGQKPWPE